MSAGRRAYEKPWGDGNLTAVIMLAVRDDGCQTVGRMTMMQGRGSMNFRSLAACVAIAAVAGGAPFLGAASASARQLGLVTCSAQPQGSQVVTTCVNDDDAPARGSLQAMCSNLRILWPLQAYQVPANSTQRFVEDCGPGASPITWSAHGETQWQAEMRQQDEEQQKRERAAQ